MPSNRTAHNTNKHTKQQGGSNVMEKGPFLMLKSLGYLLWKQIWVITQFNKGAAT